MIFDTGYPHECCKSPFGLSIALATMSCSSKSTPQSSSTKVIQSGKLAWSNADRPSLVDLDDSYNYKFDELAKGEAAQIPWAGDWVPTKTASTKRSSAKSFSRS